MLTCRNNHANLRPWAYGYPAIRRSGYTRQPIDLYDCIGCAAYDLGVDETRLDELLRFRGKASAADVLCGDVDKMYTYDTLLEAQQASEVVGSNTTGGRLGRVLSTRHSWHRAPSCRDDSELAQRWCPLQRRAKVSAYEQAGPYPRVAPEA